MRSGTGCTTWLRRRVWSTARSKARSLPVLRQLAAGQGWRATASFNLGTDAGRGNDRVPDFGAHTAIPAGARFASSALVVGEVLSPDDESYLKFGFYFAHGVAEVFIVDRPNRQRRSGCGCESSSRRKPAGASRASLRLSFAAVAFPSE